MKVVSPKTEVIAFLEELKSVLSNPEFNVSKDLDILFKKLDELPIDPYTTFNTIQTLEYDKSDILDQLMALNISEYMETVVDNKGNDLPPFFVFGKIIKKREVYIKVKIRDRENHKIFCVSFHFARFPLSTNRPYA